MKHWPLLLIVLFVPTSVWAQDAASAASGEQLSQLLKARPAADEDPDAVKVRLSKLIGAANKRYEELAGQDKVLLQREALRLMLQGMHLYMHRWPKDPVAVEFKAIVPIGARSLASLELKDDDERARADFAQQVQAESDYWLMTLKLEENRVSETTFAKKREVAIGLMQAFVSAHDSGTWTEAVRSGLRALGVRPSATVSAPTTFKLVEGVSTDKAGITNYTLKSDYQSDATKLRVLPPDNGQIDALLLVLPVEPGLGTQWGDPMAIAKKANLHNKHKLLIVMPTFVQTPWFGDHPAKAGVRQESHLTQAILKAIDQLYAPKAGDQRRRLLLGFSKSGWGAVSLLVRYPALFESAAAWDAPLMVDKISEYKMADVFGTKTYFTENYYLPDQLRQQGPALEKRARIALMGHAFFGDQMKRAHQLMNELKIPHYQSDSASTEHKWDEAWMSKSIEQLLKMKP
jgi:hypothetical protein